jgi:hypothetical protein
MSMCLGEPVEGLKPVTYLELDYWFRVGMRNGGFHRLKREQKGLLRACLMFTRRVGAIFSQFVVSQLRGIIELLKPTWKRALEAGWRRAEEMLKYFKRSGVFKWAPQVGLWLRDESYILYLGFMRLNEPSRYYYEA